ncbi:MAG: PQQ-dependent sugar dehydrogenase [Chitinophagales bacterium]
MNASKNSFLFFCTLLMFCQWTKAQETIELETTTIEVRTIAEDLLVPWEILWGVDDWIWLTERSGNVKRVNPDNGEIHQLIDIEDCYEESESGLLGMVLHPNFEETPHVFLVYTYLNGNSINERCVRYVYDESTQELQEPLVLIEGIQGNDNHNGSRLLILPDQTLLMSTGDALQPSTSQNTTSLTGKFLRMNLDGSIPTDNPFNNLIYSYGHRNAQGLILADNGILYSSEHGPNNDDELNIIQMGKNYGWPNVQGFCNSFTEQAFCDENPVTEPLKSWTPTLAVAGIDYYNHEAIPEWQNSILLTTLKQKDFRVLQMNEAGDEIVSEEIFLDRDFGRLRDVCVSPDGRIFLAVTNRDGRGTPLAGDDRIIELKNALDTNIEEISTPNFDLFPNPNNGIFTFSWDAFGATPTKDYQLHIADIYGKEIYRYEGKEALLPIDLTAFPTGMYFLQVEQNEQVWASKVVVH